MCLTRKDVPWHFTDECRSAFNALKKAFTSAPVLTHWRPDIPITSETDTSDYALTAVLSIMNSSGEMHLVAFHSHTFHAPECNHHVYGLSFKANQATFPSFIIKFGPVFVWNFDKTPGTEYLKMGN